MVGEWLTGRKHTSLPALVIAFILVALIVVGVSYINRFNTKSVMEFGHYFEKIAILSVACLILLPNIVRMFWYTIVKEKSEIELHYMRHGSFSYAGDVHGKGRLDIALLVKILEMPRRCGDLGTIFSPADINRNCRVDLDDLTGLIEQWLEHTDLYPPSS